MVVNADLIAEGVAAVKQYLNNGIVEVTFTKADGNTRVMQCTTVAHLIPDAKKPKVKTVEEQLAAPIKDKPVQLITAFDTEKQDWRSFNYTTITKIKLHQTPQS